VHTKIYGHFTRSKLHLDKLTLMVNFLQMFVGDGEEDDLSN